MSESQNTRELRMPAYRTSSGRIHLFRHCSGGLKRGQVDLVALRERVYLNKLQWVDAERCHCMPADFRGE